MPNIIGEPFPDYVNGQINIRQAAHGSGINTFRTPDQLAYLNSKTAWVKLASSVKISGSFKSKDDNIVPGSWGKLAKENVLFSGISSLSDGILTPKSTVEEKYQHSSGFGFVPMPGIIDASVKCENRGSIKKATVNIKCYSPEQFRILEVLYLRLGYTLFLEWGWSNYLDNDGKLHSDYSTLIEGVVAKDKSSFFDLDTNSKYTEFLKKIEAYRKGKDGNYDGLLCKVSNFSWNFSADGSYDIQLTLISMGDVIESLKTNVTPSKDIVKYITKVYSLYGDETNEEGLTNADEKTPPAPANDLISAYFFLQRTFVADSNLNPNYWIKLDPPNPNEEIIFGKDGTSKVASIFIKQDTNFEFEPKAEKTDFLYFSYNTLEDDEDKLNNEGFYVRFGHLIKFIKENTILKIEGSKDRIIEIDEDFENAKMYVFPYQVSLDPRVCIVGTNELLSRKIFYNNLPEWNDGKGNGANIANIYLNCAMVSRVLGEKQDEEGNISLYEVLSTICSELNLALGSVNNLETIIDEEINSIKIIDASYQPPIIEESAELQLYGYNGENSNFVYSFDLKTEITNDFATMVSIGSTAGGYAKGMENTMFSKWNKGLIDIFKENYTPPKQTSTKDDNDPPNLTYASEFWRKIFAPYGLTFPQDIENDVLTADACALSPEIIDKNLVLVPEFYKYCQYKIQQQVEKYASPTNGFIPISLGITLEGISGIKIYNYVKVNTEFLPSNYPDNLKFIIKGVNHKISANNWETSLETVVIANSSNKDGKPIKSYSEIKEIVDKEITEGKSLADLADLKANNEDNLYPPQNQIGTAAGAGEQVIPLLDQQSIANANSFLEKSMKEAATTWFKDNGETKGKCGGVTYKLANRLARKLRNKYIADVSGNHAYSSVLRTNLKNLDIYQEISFQPYGAGLTNAALKETLKTNITPHVNYGDVLAYFQTPAPNSGDAKYHAQIWTGNLYKGQTHRGYVGVGWTTDSKTNYGSDPAIVYDSPNLPWTLYWFRIKNEYKNTTGPISSTPAPTLNQFLSPTPRAQEIQKESANGFNNLTYRLSLIYRLKDDYGSGTYTPNPTYSNQQAKKYLFYDAKGILFNDDEILAVELLEQWLKKPNQKVELEKLTDKDKKEFSNYKDLLISRTKTRGNDVTFQSKHNDKVKKVTINPNF
jgi:hypothetical protein